MFLSFFACGLFAATVGVSQYVQKGLVACWDGQASAPTASGWTDASGSHTWAWTDAQGKLAFNGDSVTFPGSTAVYGTLNAESSTATFGNVKGGTIELVLKTTATGTGCALQTPKACGPVYYFESGKRLVSSSGSTTTWSDTGYRDGSVHTVTLAYNSTEGQPLATKAWRDGTLLASYGANGNVDAASYTVSTLGARNNHGNAFSGTIYAIRIYNRVLTDGELAMNAAIDSARFGFDGAPSAYTWPDGVRWNDTAQTVECRVKFDSSDETAGSVTSTASAGASATHTYWYAMNTSDSSVLPSATATAASGASFLRWTGLINGIADVTAATVSVPDVAEPRTLTALFRRDGDPIPPDPYGGDDRVTLMSAITNAAEGGTVELGEGVFHISSQLEIDKKIIFKGAGTNRTSITQISGGSGFRCLYMTAEATVKNLTITDFKSKLDGAGVYMTKGSLDNIRITGIYQQASSDNQGAAVYMTSGIITNSLIDHNYLEANYHGTKGIGVYMTGGTVVDSTICWNWMARQQHHGLGIYASGSSTILRCNIYKNYSTANQSDDVDGLYLSGSKATADNCNVYSNGLKGVYINGGTLRNSLVYGHARTDAGYAGVYLASGNLINCTITDNTSTGVKSGLDMAKGTAVNNIIYGNGTMGDVAVSDGTFNTNVIGNAVSLGVGNIVNDPKFVNKAANNFHPNFGSPAIDAAAALTDVTIDLDGLTRPQGSAPDVGCYEYDFSGGSLRCAAVLTKSRMGEGDAPDSSVQVAGVDGTKLTYQWYLDDVAVAGATGATYAPVHPDVGTHMIKVVVTQGNTSVTSEGVPFTVSPWEVYVDTEGDNEPPYNTSKKAAHSLADALDAVWTGFDGTSKVHIAAGSFEVSAMQTLGTPVQFIGAGRDATVLTGQNLGDSFRAFTLSHASALLKDLTVTGCTNTLSEGTCVSMSAGTLDNVRITHNRNNRSNACGIGVYMSGGTVTNSLIDYNEINASYYGTKGVGIYMSGGTLVDAIVCWNTMWRHQHQGVGLYACGASVVRRCDIYKNSSSSYSGDDSGGVCAEYVQGISGTPLVSDCNIYSNGNLGVQVSGSILRNSLIYGHRYSGDHAAGVKMTSGQLYNCTITDNVGTGDTTGKSGLHQTGGTAFNNVIYCNGDAATDPENAKLGGCYVTSGTFVTNITDKLANTGGAVADPKFVNAATNNFRLGRGSPARDAGVPAGLDHDLDGAPRPQGDGYDIGCYEAAQILDPVVTISAPVVAYPAGSTIEATAKLENIDAATAKFIWRLTGATDVTYEGMGVDFQSFAHQNAGSGSYSLTLTVEFDGKSCSTEEATVFSVKPTHVYVAKGKSATFPYDTLETATDDINVACNALWQEESVTSVVTVAEGDFEMRDLITLSTPVEIRGAGRDATILRGTGISEDKRAFVLSHADGVLADLTITGVTNYIYSGGAAVRLTAGRLENVRITRTWAKFPGNSTAMSATGLYMASGTLVTNCVIDHNACDAQHGGTVGVGVYMDGGTLVDSEIGWNWVNRGELTGVGLYLGGGTVTRCNIHRNQGWIRGNSYGAGAYIAGGTLEDSFITDCTNGVYVAGGTLRNSVIARCWTSAETTGGLVQAGGTVVNCTIVGNVSGYAPVADYTASISENRKGVSKNNIARYASVFETRLTQANNVFNVDPRVKNATAGKYTLLPSSPAIGAADESAWTWSDLGTAKDVNGKARVWHYGKADGHLDCGACAFAPKGLMLILR